MQQSEGTTSFVLCDYCGDDILSRQDTYPEGDRLYHETCYRVHIPWSNNALKEFRDSVPSNENILSIGINVSYLYGKDKEDKKFREAKRKKRDKRIQQLLQYVSALRNTNSGYILIHLVGLEPGDTFTGAFDEFADDKLNGLIQDGKLFASVYKKQMLSSIEELSEFSDFLALFVASSSFLTTSDYRTKIALDDRIIDPSPQNVRTFLTDGIKFNNKFHNLRGVTYSEDLQNIRENRCVQFKGNFLDNNDPEIVVDHMFSKLKLGEYVSAFSKNEDGGSYLFGVKEETVTRGRYKTQSLCIQPLTISDTTSLEHLIHRKTIDSILVCDYKGNVQTDANIVQVVLIPSRHDKYKIVPQISVRSVTGLVFYDKSGPLAYKYERGTDSVVRIAVQDWFLLIQKSS